MAKKKNKSSRDLEAILKGLNSKQPKQNRMDRLENEIEKRRLEIISLAVALDESKVLHEKVMVLAKAVQKHLEIFSDGAEQLANRLDKLEPMMDKIEAYILPLEEVEETETTTQETDLDVQLAGIGLKHVTELIETGKIGGVEKTEETEESEKAEEEEAP